MKLRMMLSALLIAAGLVFVTGCGNKDEKKSDDSKNDPLAVQPVTDVANRLFQAQKEQDFDTIIKLSYGKARENAEKFAEQVKDAKKRAANGDVQAMRQLEMVQKWSEVTYKIKRVKIKGDFAVIDVSITSDGETILRKMHFKKVGGVWWVITPDDYNAD